MEVLCPSCSTGYRIPPEKVPSRPRMLMCKSCGTAWRQGFPARAHSLDGQPSKVVIPFDKPARRPQYAQGVLAILREEAALEQRLRKA